MSNLRLYFVTALCLIGLVSPALATDFGDAKDIKQVRKMVGAKFGHALHASVSHDWALCAAYSDASDLAVVLHRTDSGWKIIASDGGAYVGDTLKPLGAPNADIAAPLKVYQ